MNDKIIKGRLSFHRVQRFLWIIIYSFYMNSCYSLGKNYNYGENFHDAPDLWNENNPQFEVGEPIWILDTLGNYIFSIPSKLIFLNSQVDNHHFSEETIEITKKYIYENNLRSVKIRFNQYAPVDEFKRILANPHINPFVKYTVGLISWLTYTIFPERLFAGLIGGDHYNPFSNTMNLYSNLPSIAIHEGGHAKDFNAREYKTLYAIIYSIPFIGPLYHEGVATDDTFSYFHEKNQEEYIEESYEILIPAYSTYMGGAISDGIRTPYSILTVIPGHIYGQYKKWVYKRDKETKESMVHHQEKDCIPIPEDNHKKLTINTQGGL